MPDQGLPLRDEIEKLIETGVIECVPESDTTDAVLAVIRTRIADMAEFHSRDPEAFRDAVLALFGGGRDA